MNHYDHFKFPCTCGHSGEHHRGIGMLPKNQHCWVFECLCKGFTPDNLRFLEEKSNDNN